MMTHRPSTHCAARLVLAVVSSLATGAGCTTRPPEPSSPAARSTPKARDAATTRATYRLVGVVKKVDPEVGQVVIAHEAVPGFMEAMTMPFLLKDRTLLQGMVPGDEVEGELRVEKAGETVKDYELADLVVTRPALAAPKRLVFSTKTATVSEAPRRLEPGQPVPDFTMTTQDGTSVRLSDLRGEVVVLTFIYTRCPLPDFCPLMDRKFAELAEKLSASPQRAARVRLFSISFDPEHDTPEILRKHAQVQGARPPLWTFAVASHEELAKVAAPLGLMYGPSSNEIIHNLSTAVIDPQGRLARLEVGSSARSWSATDIVKLIASLVPRNDAPAAAPAAR